MAARERPTKYVYSIHIHNVIGNQSKNFPTVPMSKSDFFLQYTYIPQQGILLYICRYRYVCVYFFIILVRHGIISQ